MKVDGTEKEIDEMIFTLQSHVPHSGISDLIYWNEDDLTPEQIVDKALDYNAIQL